MHQASYKDLVVWQKSVDLGLRIYKATERFSVSERYGLTSQMRRAAVSIPSNIAEGRYRKSVKEFTSFLHIAFGSGAELETQLLFSFKLGYLPKDEFNKLNDALDEIMKMLNTLIRVKSS
jgi:four helix bundle protein